MKVAALFVSPRGVYSRRSDVDPWDAKRDARTYAGSAPVVAHPPCNLWVNLAVVNWKRYGRQRPAWYPGGDDGGCFESALATIRRVGGVIEHPAHSHAWKVYKLPKPRYGKRGFGWTSHACGLWVCEVWQSAYGHLCAKRTWLLYCGARPPFELNWERVAGSHQIGWFDRSKPTVAGDAASATPPLFADTLIALAYHSKGEQPVNQIQTTEPTPITRQADPIVAMLRASSEAFRDWAKEFAVEINAAKLELATQAIKAAKLYREAIDEHRKAIVEGPKRELRKIDESFATARDPYTEGIDTLQRALGEYLATQNTIAANAFDAGSAAAAAGDVATAVEQLERYNAANVAHAGTLAVDVTVEIVNPSLVPSEWWRPDIERLQAAREADPKLTVAGVLFHESPRLVVTKPRNSKKKGVNQ